MVLYHHFPSFSSSVLCCCSCCCCCCCCCFLSFFFDNDSPSHLASLYTLINCDKCFPRTIYGGSVRKVEPVDTCPLPPPTPPHAWDTRIISVILSHPKTAKATTFLHQSTRTFLHCWLREKMPWQIPDRAQRQIASSLSSWLWMGVCALELRPAERSGQQEREKPIFI